MSRMKEMYYTHSVLVNSLRLLATLENAEKMGVQQRALHFGSRGVSLMHSKLRSNLEELRDEIVNSTVMEMDDA